MPRTRTPTTTRTRTSRRLARYTDRLGTPREIVMRRGAGGSVLVIDRELRSHADARLVAHLAADEPAENAAIVCRSYLQDDPEGAGRCRALTDADLRAEPFVGAGERVDRDAQPEIAIDRRGRPHRLALLDSGMSIPELRWRCEAAPAAIVSVRQLVARLESYEPVCTLTARALALAEASDDVSTTTLRMELQRVQESPTVLNRRLRETVLATVACGRLSMSEIALRCGRVKRDGRGNESGETSWLARRLGLLPEGGTAHVTPWIHSDVLALIARRGLGVSPREVEL